MNTLQKTQIITQIIGAVVLIVTLGFYYLQLRTMGKQLATMRRGADAQQILSLLTFIDSDEVRAALTVVYTTLHRKHFSKWTESEAQSASRICSSFATVGAIVRSGLVPVEPLLEGWDQSLRRCYEILEPFLREMQRPENGGPQYWNGFDWLYGQLDSPKAVGRTTQNLHRGGRKSDTKAISKHRTAEVNNVS